MMTGFALYTLTLSLNARHTAEAALVAEPSLAANRLCGIDPAMCRTSSSVANPLPELKFSFKDRLIITGSEGNQFHDWLIALSYIDTISPQYHWAIQQLCVGKCPSHDLMHAELIGQKVTFEMPQSDLKR